MLIWTLKILAFLVSIASIILFLWLMKTDLQRISGKEHFVLTGKAIAIRILSYALFSVFMAVFIAFNAGNPEPFSEAFRDAFIGGMIKTCFRTFPAVFILMFVISSGKSGPSSR